MVVSTFHPFNFDQMSTRNSWVKSKMPLRGGWNLSILRGHTLEFLTVEGLGLNSDFGKIYHQFKRTKTVPPPPTPTPTPYLQPSSTNVCLLFFFFFKKNLIATLPFYGSNNKLAWNNNFKQCNITWTHLEPIFQSSFSWKFRKPYVWFSKAFSRNIGSK